LETEALKVNSDLEFGKISFIKSHETSRHIKDSETIIYFTDIFILYRF